MNYTRLTIDITILNLAILFIAVHSSFSGVIGEGDYEGKKYDRFLFSSIASRSVYVLTIFFTNCQTYYMQSAGIVIECLRPHFLSDAI